MMPFLSRAGFPEFFQAPLLISVGLSAASFLLFLILLGSGSTSLIEALAPPVAQLGKCNDLAYYLAGSLYIVYYWIGVVLGAAVAGSLIYTLLYDRKFFLLLVGASVIFFAPFAALLDGRTLIFGRGSVEEICASEFIAGLHLLQFIAFPGSVLVLLSVVRFVVSVRRNRPR